jgi:alanine racemase
MKHSPNHIIINASALQENYKFLTGKVGQPCQTAAVVKANGYGLGVDIVVPALEQAGAKFFYVAHFAEALAVRQLTSSPIALLGGLPRGAADDYKHHRIVPVLNTAEDIADCPADLPAIWHIDTGMNRLGLSVSEVSTLASQAKSLPILMMTHFTSSDDTQSSHAAEQVRKFDDCIAGLPKPFQIIPQSICNSSGIFRHENWHRAQVRPGVALYGANPTPEAHNPMQTVVSMETRILQIHQGHAGETVGYNQTETLEKDTTLATVGLGYADGFLRSGSSRAKLYWHGQSCKIMGRVSMDLIVVELSNLKNCPSPKQGDYLEVLGNHQSVDQLAVDLGTISYEVLTSLSHRAERIVR